MTTYVGPLRMVGEWHRLPRDYDNGGDEPGTIGPFTVKTQTAPGVEIPTWCKVVLYRDHDNIAVRKTMTHPVTGEYTFVQLDRTVSYTPVAYHPTQGFRAVLADGLYPT